ncbi:MAG TPA: hypothetical protein ENN21_04650 [Spirochaetes bacterium]|nr:hypothetical protein [Spirochaetota bacterium]
MIRDNDEFLHDYRRNARWIERFSVNFIDRKNKLFGFADVNFYFLNKKTEFHWAVFLNDQIYAHQHQESFKEGVNQKVFADKNLKYRVKVPRETIELEMKNEYLQCALTVNGAYPVYMFPSSVPDDAAAGFSGKKPEFWERYEQRCRATGMLTVKKGEKKGFSKKIDCIGFRKHSWGERYPEDMSSYSWITVQFRDMTIDLTYMEIDRVSYSGGFISKKSGNIPVMCVEQELFSMSRDRKSLLSSEFSYRDAQDDRDLIVSRKLHSLDMPLPRNRKSKYIRIRSFSEFMVIGTGKRGIGMEEHYFSLDKLDKML